MQREALRGRVGAIDGVGERPPQPGTAKEEKRPNNPKLTPNFWRKRAGIGTSFHHEAVGGLQGRQERPLKHAVVHNMAQDNAQLVPTKLR